MAGVWDERPVGRGPDEALGPVLVDAELPLLLRAEAALDQVVAVDGLGADVVVQREVGLPGEVARPGFSGSTVEVLLRRDTIANGGYWLAGMYAGKSMALP